MESGEKVLIVDPDRATRESFTEVALGLDFTVLAGVDTQSGKECFDAELPRIVVVDWAQGNSDALEFCRKIKAGALGEYLVILVVTNRDQPEDLETALASGVDFFIKKPVREEFFRAWLTVAAGKVAKLRSHETYESELQRYKEELENTNQQLEEEIARANQMAMEAEKAFIEVNQVFRTVSGGIILIDDSYNIIRHNDNFREMVGPGDDELLHRKCYDVFPSTLCHTPDCPMKLLKGGKSAVENQICRTVGEEETHYRLQARPFRGLVGEFMGIVEYISDITAMVRAEEALRESEERYRRLSIIDELTGLYNKRHFNNHLGSEMDRARRYQHDLSLIIMDIDNFKRHNDTYGHAEGDKVLTRLGEILNASVRSTDLACRYGGEEFVVILPDTPLAGATVVAERIRERFASEEFIPDSGEKVCKTLSLGVTQFHGEDDMDVLVKRADANLYRAKETGKNRVVSG